MLMSKASNSVLLVTLAVLMFFNVISSSLPNKTFNVIDLGADPDGKTDSTNAFLDAWELSSREEFPNLIYVPPGTYVVQKMNLTGHDNNPLVTFGINGTLSAPWDYRDTGEVENWITFNDVNNVRIEGGILDGHGATTLGFFGSNVIEISGLTSLNSKMFHIVINGCHRVTLEGVKVLASGSPNAYGLHLHSSSEVNISSYTNNLCGRGDNCVSIGGGITDLYL
ncbi:hypothetical protein LguiA_028973 [Lonicera macranthoides]